MGLLFVRTSSGGLDPDTEVADLGFTVPSGTQWTEMPITFDKIPFEASGQFTSIELKNSRDLYDKIISGELEWSTDGISIAASGLYTSNYALVEDLYEDIFEREELASQRIVLLDEVGDLTYVGEAAAGTATSSPAWRIFRLDESASGDEELIKLYGGGSTDFDQIWDNRLALSYS